MDILILKTLGTSALVSMFGMVLVTLTKYRDKWAPIAFVSTLILFAAFGLVAIWL